MKTENRADLIRTAQEIFGKKSISCIHAFSQFKNKGDLFRIVQAKKYGVFDYGKYITKVKGRWTYPRASAVIEELQQIQIKVVQAMGTKVPELADAAWYDAVTFQEGAKKTATEEIIKMEREKELTLMGKRDLQRLHLKITGARSTRGEAAKFLIERILAKEGSGTPAPEEEVVVDEVVELPLPKPVEVEAELVSVEEDTVIDIPYEEPEAKVAPTEENLIEPTLKQILMSQAESLIQIKEILASLLEQAAKVPSTAAGVRRVPKIYARGELTLMSLDKLRGIAKRLEVQNASGVAFAPFLINKILEKQIAH